MKIILLFFLSMNFIFSQCSELGTLECNLNSDCEWIEDIETGNCSNYDNSSSCDANDNCNWDCIQYGWWYNWCYTYGCEGGNYQIDNGYCQEIEMPECSELDELNCNHPLYGDGCEWIENDINCENISSESECDSNNCDWNIDFETGNCSSLSVSACYDYPGQCYVDSNPGWYDNSGPYCTGGTYQIDNSYCDG